MYITFFGIFKKKLYNFEKIDIIERIEVVDGKFFECYNVNCESGDRRSEI